MKKIILKKETFFTIIASSLSASIALNFGYSSNQVYFWLILFGGTILFNIIYDFCE